uniref:DUF1985 domain-containing protein n=1 Tax=Brassica oleracea var. oleracea TaxID=109376 RepID=A0A0D3BDQ2_BRAOL
MVSPSSVTPSRRVTRCQSASDREAIPKKIPRESKTVTRYAVMNTKSEVEEPASTDQEEAASTEQDEAASTEPEFIVTTPTFPERLFARNCYPGKPRLNIYSKASIIGSLVKLLRGSPEMNCLLGSQFGALFHLPVSRCSNSAKLVHSLLSRQLVTMRLYELWFLFADKPLRFSLREFGDITGLKCEPEREKVGNGSESIDATPGHEGGDPKWKKEVIDPRIDNLVGRMREGHEFKATLEECQKPSRRFGKACDEPGSSTQAPERPIRPRRGICKQAEPGNLSDKEQELKSGYEGGSSTVLQNTAAGKTNRDNSHADPTGMEVPKKRRPLSGDGNDEAEIFGSDSKKHKKNNGNGFSDDETMRMHDNHCDGHSMAGEGPSFSKSANIPEVDVSTPIGPETVSKPAKPTLPEPLEGEGGDESPISWLNLLAEEVEKGTRSDNVYKDPQENTCRMLTVWSHPESFVLPPEEQGAGYSYEDMGQIDDKKVDIFRQKYAMDTYEEFIGNAKVQNDG